MATILVEGKKVSVPDGLSEKEMNKIVSDLDTNPPKSMVSLAKEAVAAPVLPLAAGLGLPGAKKATERMFDIRAGRFGLGAMGEKAGQAVESSVNSSVKNIKENIGKAEDFIAASKFAQKNPELSAALTTSLTTMPKMSLGVIKSVSPSLKPSEMQLQTGAEALGPGVEIASEAAGKGAKVLAKAALKTHLPPSAPEDAMDIITKHPEVTKPGYFKKHIDEFTASVTSALDELVQKAKNTSNAFLKKYGNKPVMDVPTLKGNFSKALSGLRPEVMASQETDKVLSPVFDRLDAIEKNGGKVPISALVEYKKVLKDAFSEAGKSAKTQTVQEGLLKAINDLDKTIEAIPKAGKTAGEMRRFQKERYSAVEDLKSLVGADPSLDPTDAKTKLKVVSSLKNAIKAEDTTMLSTLDKLKPGLAEEARKLTVASSGAFDKFKPIIPTIGMANLGWAMHNAPRAVPAAALLAGGSLLTSPRTVASLFRAVNSPGAAEAAKTAYTLFGKTATRGAQMLLPSIKKKQ